MYLLINKLSYALISKLWFKMQCLQTTEHISWLSGKLTWPMQSKPFRQSSNTVYKLSMYNKIDGTQGACRKVEAVDRERKKINNQPFLRGFWCSETITLTSVWKMNKLIVWVEHLRFSGPEAICKGHQCVPILLCAYWTNKSAQRFTAKWKVDMRTNTHTHTRSNTLTHICIK